MPSAEFNLNSKVKRLVNGKISDDDYFQGTIITFTEMTQRLELDGRYLTLYLRDDTDDYIEVPASSVTLHDVDECMYASFDASLSWSGSEMWSVG